MPGSIYLDNIFRLFHTIKGTCGFLGLPRLETVAHAAETLMSRFRDGAPVTGEAVTLVLFAIDRIKEILDELERHQREPDSSNGDLIRLLEAMVERCAAPGQKSTRQTPARPLRPGEVSLEELERVFQETPGPVPPPAVAKLDPPDSESVSAARGEQEGQQLANALRSRSASISSITVIHGVRAGADPQPAARHRAPA